MAQQRIAEVRAGELFDILAEGDATSADILARTGWRYSQFLKAVQKLRDICAVNGDVISVTAEPQGQRGSKRGANPWLYGLKAGKAVVDPEQSKWITNRMGDVDRRIKTIKHVLEVAVNSLDGRSKLGRRARIYLLHINRAQEEIALTEEQQPLL